MPRSPAISAVIRLRRGLFQCVMLIAGAHLLACGSESDDDSTAKAEQAVADAAELGLVACNFDQFEADITDGPSAGLHLEGALMLMLEPPGSQLAGSLATSDGIIPVTGALYGEGEISLTFHTAVGYVMGLGKLSGDFCAEGGELKGIAIGPQVSDDESIAQSDTGRWLIASPNLIGKFGKFSLADDPLSGSTTVAAVGCVTDGNTQTCTSHTFADAGSATGCSQSTSTCTFDGTKNTCSSTKVPVFCPNGN